MKKTANSLTLALTNWALVGADVFAAKGWLGRKAPEYIIFTLAFFGALLLLTVLFALNDLRKPDSRVQAVIALLLAIPFAYFFHSLRF